MKLELKHLAPYLPYGISIEVSEYNNKYITDSWGLKCQSDYLVSEYNRGVRKGLTLTQVKPILRPLSDLTKEIEHKGEKFVPFDRYSDIFGSNDDVLFENMNNENNEMHYSVCKELPHYVFDWLVSFHFDVFGLIDAGLAIDINTLNN